jgi:hypothetical protein
VSLVLGGSVAAHAFRRLGEVSVASQPSLPGWDAFIYSLTSFRAMAGVKWHISLLAAAISASYLRHAPSLGNELLSALSQLKHWNLRTSEFDRDEVPEINVIGARQFGQGWISILLEVKQNSCFAADMTLPPIVLTESDSSIQKGSLQRRSNIASKTLPNLINPLIKRAESVMNALVVKAKYIAN